MLLLPRLLAWIASPIGAVFAGLAVMAALVMSYGAQQRSVGASQAVAKIERQSVDLARRGSEARKAATEPGSLKRLQAKYCYDCEGQRGQ